MTKQAMAASFRDQQKLCQELGSEVYSTLLGAAAVDISAGGPVWDVMRHIDSLGPASYAPLRLMGSVHRLVLEGHVPALARHYPSAGGQVTDGLIEDFIDTVGTHADSLTPMLAKTPQTNEVARSAALLVGFFEAARTFRLPLRILEIGSSAGLNLVWDQYRYESKGWAWGPQNSPVLFANPFVGEPPAPAEVFVTERAGCDLAPVDVRRSEGLLTLLSYVWPDQTVRIERLRAAASLVAQLDPAIHIAKADAVEWLSSQLSHPVEGAVTIVTHSIVTAYFDEATLASYERVLAQATARASAASPIAEVALERVGDRFEVGFRRWPDMQRRTLALASGHGLPIHVLPHGGQN